MQAEQVQRNIQLLEISCQVIQSLIKEKNIKKSAQYYEAFELVAALRILIRRKDQEVRNLAALRGVQPPRPSELPPLPPTPEEVRKDPSSAKKSDFFQAVWGAIGRLQ